MSLAEKIKMKTNLTDKINPNWNKIVFYIAGEEKIAYFDKLGDIQRISESLKNFTRLIWMLDFYSEKRQLKVKEVTIKNINKPLLELIHQYT